MIYFVILSDEPRECATTKCTSTFSMHFQNGNEQSRLLKLAREKGLNLRKKHRENEREVVMKLRDRLEVCFEKKSVDSA